jgi:hypothetical protein
MWQSRWCFQSPPELVVLAAWWQGTPLDRQQDHFAQLRHVLAAFLCELHIAPKLRLAYRV